MAEDLDYVPMPDKVVGAIQKVVGGADQGQGRQAAVRAIQLTIASERGATSGALSLSTDRKHDLRGCTDAA